jgi:DNA-binding transcriptional LysR family regulator
MTLHQLKVFSKVAKLRSFTLTAASLDVTQPSVTFVIQSLERELGAKLFEKLGNKVHLSGAGKKLLHHAQEILAKVERIKEEINEIKGVKKGKLTVGGAAVAAASFLPPAVREFKKKFPGIEVILKVQTIPILEKLLLDGELDVAFYGLEPSSPHLASEPFFKEEVVAFAPPNHPLAKKRSVSLELLAKEPLIAHEKGSPTRDIIEERFVKKGLPFTPVLELNFFGGRDVIRNAVANGEGIGFLSRCIVSGDAQAGRVKLLNVPELKLYRPHFIVLHRSRKISAAVRAFIDFLKHYQRTWMRPR